MKKIIVLCVAVCIMFTACGTTGKTTTDTSIAKNVTTKVETDVPESTTAEATAPGKDIFVHLDYGDEQSFEAALNEGEALQGKTVRFTADELHPESKYGYNIWSGVHLNFISDYDPNVQAGELLTVKVLTAEKVNYSWMITYEFVENAVEDDDTIICSNSKTTENEDSDKKYTYQHNKYYDVIETASFKNSIGYTVIIHKILAKQNVSVSSSLLAYDADGNVIGKSSDDIVLTEGQYNFFRYSFEGDVSNASFQANANAKSDSFKTGERNAVEMLKYNKSGDDLFITLQQTGDVIGSFAKLKLLLYKDNQIVESEREYLNIHAENLNGNGSTDVADISVYGTEFDRVEFIFEP